MEAVVYSKANPNNDYFMAIAETQASLSTDLRRPIGCIVVLEGKIIIGYGSNQASIRWAWLQRFHVKHCFRKLIGIKKHAFYWICPGCALFRNHAEVRAIRSCSRVDRTGKRVEMYMHGHDYCCERCVQEIKRFGIIKVHTFYEHK